MKVGIQDVAKAAGVSNATVSRALSGGPVSEALRAQVEAAVRATGYRPNLSARRLRSRSTRTIGLIVADIRNPFFTAVSRSVEDAAYAAGMRVILCNTDEDPAREAMYLRLMAEERVTGAILAPTRGGGPIGDLDFPTVLIDRVAPAETHDSVVLDNAAACTELVDHLVGQGYVRIGGLFGSTSTTAVERRAAYEAAMAAHGLTPLVRTTVPTAAAAERAATAWLSEKDRPEALLLSNGQSLMGAVRAARALGLALPSDIAIAGFDNEAWTDLVEPGITVVEQPVDAFGAEAMRVLFERIASPDRPVGKAVLKGRVIARGSTGRA